MKKIAGIVVFLFAALIVNAQCPVSVQITASHPNPVCKNTDVTYTAVPTNGGAAPQYFWVINGDTVSTASFVVSSANFLYLELYMISSSGCPLDSAFSSYNLINVETNVEYTVIIEECNQPVADVQILNVTGDNPPFTYNFYTDAGDLGQQELYSDITVSSYPLVIQDGGGCVDTFWVDMTVLECPTPIPTEVITPNGDGNNDTWKIAFIDLYPNNEVYVFDRWGQRVYHKKGYDNTDGWDAKYVGTDMPVSTYYYIIKIKYEKQDELIFQGPISVFR